MRKKQRWIDRFILGGVVTKATDEWVELYAPASLDEEIRALLSEGEDMDEVWHAVARKRAVDALQDAQSEIDLIVSKAESPIESAMLAALYLEGERQTEGCFLSYEGMPFRGSHPVWNLPIPSHLVIQPQVKVGEYRVDLLLTLGDYSNKSGQVETVQAVVECDGHDYHERTKEQAKRDRRRDRALQDLGYLVLRFTGSEIWEDPLGCARQAIESLYRRHRELHSDLPGGRS